jgi:rfaE bifunctional protein nucleotidyltransferase chain/domain
LLACGRDARKDRPEACATRIAHNALNVGMGRNRGCQAVALPQNCAVNFKAKLIAWEDLARWREDLRRTGRRLVVTNGCFDVLHVGHVTYLEAARNEGDTLLVGVTGDAGVRSLKGEGRPINAEQDRALVLAGLESVGGVCVFPDETAMRFLERAQPDIYVKGGDYTIDSINQEERRYVESMGGRIAILANVPGKSTSAMLAKIAKL